jgi:hypothetical protein
MGEGLVSRLIFIGEYEQYKVRKTKRGDTNG